MKSFTKRAVVGILAGIVVLAVLAAVFLGFRKPSQPLDTHAMAQASPGANQVSAPAVTNSVHPPVVKTTVIANYPDFKMRPLSVGIESTNNQWALADGKDTNVIRQLAHNPLEYARMVDENARIFRRQLVYLKETAAAVFEQARLTDSPVTQLTLPALDGRELTFEIARRQDAGSSRRGMFSGHLAGNADSLVTMAYEDGREAFTILSPKDNVFVVGEPRENGQVIVKAIDPNTYGVGPAPGDAQDVIKTVPANK
jgi:hypothetical protein